MTLIDYFECLFFSTESDFVRLEVGFNFTETVRFRFHFPLHFHRFCAIIHLKVGHYMVKKAITIMIVDCMLWLSACSKEETNSVLNEVTLRVWDKLLLDE